jgi:hypothetical protein
MMTVDSLAFYSTADSTNHVSVIWGGSNRNGGECLQASSTVIFLVAEAEELRAKLDAAIEKAKAANAAKDVQS